MIPPPDPVAPRSRLALYLGLGYLLVIAFASLSPFTGWRDGGVPAFQFLGAAWPRYYTAFDVGINFLAYVPLGFLLCLAALRTTGPVVAAIVAAVLALAFSLGMEAAQTFLPGRIANKLDLLANGLGGLAGAAWAARAGRSPLIAVHLVRLRARWFLAGTHIDLGLAVLALWFVSQLDPSLPLAGSVLVSESVREAVADLHARRTFSMTLAASVFANTLAVGLFLKCLMRPWRSVLGALAALMVAAVAIKLVSGGTLLRSGAALHWMGPEVTFGIGYAAVLLWYLSLLPRPRLLAAAAAVLALAGLALAIYPEGESAALSLRLFAWHYGHLLNFTGLARIMGDLWPFLALAYLYTHRSRLAAERS